MGFVSALLLAIAMTVIQMGNIYTRGITFKNVNQAGGSIASELQRSIANSSYFNVTPNGPLYVKNVQSGRLCTGQYSYVWNYGKYIKTPGLNYIKYASDNSVIYFAKIHDSSLSVCTKNILSGVYPDINKFDAVELLGSGQFDLAIHNFIIRTNSSATDLATNQALYTIEFILGTNETTALQYDANGIPICRLAGDIQADTLYCALNRFDIVARAGKG